MKLIYDHKINKNTQEWELQVISADDINSWTPLRKIPQCNALELAEYFVDHNIFKEPEINTWVKKNLFYNQDFSSYMNNIDCSSFERKEYAKIYIKFGFLETITSNTLKTKIHLMLTMQR